MLSYAGNLVAFSYLSFCYVCPADQSSRRLKDCHPAQVQEEMAWRVANLIVKDVTSVTLGLGGGSPTHRPPW